MLTKDGGIGYFDPGDLASYLLIKFQPELAGIGLRFGDRSPIIGYMLVLTGNLAVVAPIAD